MASADGGEQEAGGSQLAVPDATEVAGGGEQMPQDDSGPQLPHNGGEEEGGRSQLAIPNAAEMPEHFMIGTPKAFQDNDAYACE